MAFPKLCRSILCCFERWMWGWREQREQSEGCEGQERNLQLLCWVGWMRLAEEERSSQPIKSSTATPSQCNLSNNPSLPKPSLCSSFQTLHSTKTLGAYEQLCKLLWLPLTSPTSSCGCSRGSASPAALCGGDPRRRVIHECAVVRKIPSGAGPGRHLLW